MRPAPPGVPQKALCGSRQSEADESFELDAAAEAELLLSLAQADRGERIPAENVLQRFRKAD